MERVNPSPAARTHHGHSFVDRFEWLRDSDDPAVLAHYEAENARADARLAPLQPLQERIVAEIRARTEETDLSVPAARGAWWYYSRTIEGSEYPLQCRAPRLAGSWEPPRLDAARPIDGEQVLLDGNAEAAGHEFFELGSFDVSADGERLLVAVDTVGDERYALTVRRIADGALLAGPIAGTFAGALFAPDGSVVYPTVDDAWRPDRLWRHRVGGAGPDELLAHEADERFWLDADLGLDDETVVITAASSVTSEVRLWAPGGPPGGPVAEPTLVWPRAEGVDCAVTPAPAAPGREAGLLLLDNADDENFSLRWRPAAATGPAEDRLLVTGGAEIRLESVTVLDAFVAVEYRRDGLPRVAAVPNAALAPGLDLRAHELGDPAALASRQLGRVLDRAQPLLRVRSSSLVAPDAIEDVAVLAPGRPAALRKRRGVPGYRPEDYRQWREWATAPDGVRVPISLVARADALPARFGGTAADAGPLPLHLYGYGAYEVSIDPEFSVSRLAVLDRGGVFAIAHVRGGGELGRGWYEDGRLGRKANSFVDVVACADHLIAGGLTAPDRLVLEGRSAGGLLVGAAANLAPDRFAGVLAGVPFVDPLTSMLDPELPLTVVEWDEWGNPLADPEIYRLMRDYSPYENVAEGVRYPEILAVASLNDTRVLAVEPAKWVARLREVGAAATLRTEMTGGHGGVSGRTAAWAERAGELAWLLDVMGLAGAAPLADAVADAAAAGPGGRPGPAPIMGS